MGDFLTAPRGELIALVYELIEENKKLRFQVAELEAKIKDPPQQEKTVASFVKANAKQKRKKGRKQREIGFGRGKDTPTQQIVHAYDVCPDCGGALGKPSVAYTRQVVDIPLPQKEVIEHVVYKRWCFHCGKRTYPKLELDGMVVGHKRIGLNTMSLIDLLREQMILPLNKIQQYMLLVYNLTLSEGTIVGMFHKTAAMGKSDYVHIKQEIRKAAVVYADGREGEWDQWISLGIYEQTMEIHGLSKKQSQYRCDRGTGERGGTLVTDFYAAYNIYQGFHQRCEVHLGRDIKELKENNPKDKKLKRWGKQVMNIFHEAKAYSGPDSTLPLVLQAQQRIEKEAYFKKKLRKISEPYITKDVSQSVLCNRIIKHLSELFTFVRFPNVEPDNNRAERGMRQLVLARKISGGTRSKKGSETKSILASLFGTWRLQGLNPLEQTRLLLLRSP
jgi:transposase